MSARADAAPDILDAPACGARIFVVMGVNQNYPQRENMRVPRGDLFLNGALAGAISKNPEIAVLDVPAGAVDLSWVPSSYDKDTRTKTRQNTLTLKLGDKATAFVVLDWYDDTPNAATIGYRTEVVEARQGALKSQRVAFHRSLPTPCAADMVTAEAASQAPPQILTPLAAPLFPSAVSPVAPPAAPMAVFPAVRSPQPLPQLASEPKLPAVAVPAPTPAPASLPTPAPAPVPQQLANLAPPPALPSAIPSTEPRPDAPDVSDAFTASLHYYYVVNSRGGAPAYVSASAEGTPLYTFPDATELKVANVSADKRWLTVAIPGGNRTGFVSTAIVTSGLRAAK